MRILCVDPVQDPLWQQLVFRRPSSVFHSPAWLRVLQNSYDFDLRAHILQDERGRPRGGIPFALIDDMMDTRVVSLPFSDFCDPLAETAADWDMLIGSILDQGHRLRLRCLHNDLPLADERFTLANRARWHGIDLQRDEEEVWMGLRGSARRAIKKARGKGVEIRCAESSADLRSFFNLHLHVRKYKYQLLAQPYRFFEQIWEQFILPGKGALLLAAYQDEVIGGVMFLEWQHTLYYKFNASLPQTIALRPNDLVLWEGIRYGIAGGLHLLDFGLSDWDQEGLLQYKRKYATTEKTISMLGHQPNGGPSAKEKQLRQLLPQLTDLFVNDDVPDKITEKAGDALYHLFT